MSRMVSFSFHSNVGGVSFADRDYVQDERYIAIEQMDVRRDPQRMLPSDPWRDGELFEDCAN